MNPELELEEDSVAPRPPRAKILLVDDDPNDLLYYTAILKQRAYDVRPCGSYTGGATLLDRESYDLVIVSQGGRSFEGRPVLARAIEVDRTTPVLVLTHSSDMATYIEAMQLGAFNYLEKPLHPSQLAELVAFHLRITRPVRGIVRKAEWEVAAQGVAH